MQQPLASLLPSHVREHNAVALCLRALILLLFSQGQYLGIISDSDMGQVLQLGNLILLDF